MRFYRLCPPRILVEIQTKASVVYHPLPSLRIGGAFGVAGYVFSGEHQLIGYWGNGKCIRNMSGIVLGVLVWATTSFGTCLRLRSPEQWPVSAPPFARESQAPEYAPG